MTDRLLRPALLLLTLAAPAAWAQPVLTEDAKLVGSGADSVATSGWAIAAAEGFVVLGAFRDDSAPTTGAAYVFRETDGVWEEEVRLNASQQSYYTFGMAVDAWSDGSEDVVIAGARGDGFQPETDAAYIFRRFTDTEWMEEVRLTNGPDVHETNGPDVHEAFGSAVAVHGDYAVVGAFGADDVGEASGAAYIYRHATDGTWVEDARLLASDASTAAGFGRKVAIVVSGDGVPFVLAGAPSDSDQRGAAYAFRREPNGTWVEEAKLLAPDGEPYDLFGRAVALAETPSGEVLALAGAVGHDPGGVLSAGAGYIFRRSQDGSWVFEQKLTAANGTSGQRLGWSVALAPAPEAGADAVAVLGAEGAYNFAGTVRVFGRTSNGGALVWREEAELWASDRAPGEELGYSVGASGRYAVAGAPYDDPKGGPAGRGAGYVWDLRRAVPAEPEPAVSAERVELAVYPNPAAGGEVTVRLHLPADSHVRLDAYDLLGRRVATLMNGRVAAGETLLLRSGVEEWSPGTYFLRLRAGPALTTFPLTITK